MGYLHIGQNGHKSAAIIVFHADSAVDTYGAVGIVFLDYIVSARNIPHIGRLIPSSIEPYFAHFSIVAHQFFKLACHEIDVFIEVFAGVRGFMRSHSE